MEASLNNKEKAELMQLRAFKAQFDRMYKTGAEIVLHLYTKGTTLSFDSFYESAMTQYHLAYTTIVLDEKDLEEYSGKVFWRDEIHSLSVSKFLNARLQAFPVGFAKSLNEYKANMSYDEDVAFEKEVFDYVLDHISVDEILDVKRGSLFGKEYVYVTYDIDTQTLLKECERSVKEQHKAHKKHDMER